MNWNDIEEIAKNLEENYADEEVPENNLSYLREMVLSLTDFESHEEEVEDLTLKRIIEQWLELRSH